MVFSKWGKAFVIVLVSLMISHIPQVASATVVGGEMISTMDVVETLSRDEAEAKVRSYLDRKEFRSELIKLGVSPEEVSMRVGSLSTAELNKLAVQMEEAQYGGDIVGILIVVILVLVIIYFAKRV